MSLIYAQKSNDSVYLLADSFSENALTRAKTDWYLNPVVKIISLNDTYVVAYAGSAWKAKNTFDEYLSCENIHLIDFLSKAHIESIDTDFYVEFAVVDKLTFELTQIKDGKIEIVTTCYLGSQSAFEILQRYRHASDQQSTSQEVSFSVIKLPEINGKTNSGEPQFSTSASIYSRALRAFQSALDNADETFGGFAVPYVISLHETGYQFYSQTYRAPLEEIEFGLLSESTVRFQDLAKGGYQLIFSGGKESFSAHYVNGHCGVIYRGFETDGIETWPRTNIDPYDFTFAAKKFGVGPSLNTWSNLQNNTRKAVQLIHSGQLSRAINLLKDMSTVIEKKLSSEDDGITLDFSNNIISSILNQKEVVVSIEDINTISAILELRLEIFRRQGLESKANEVFRELITWNDTLKNARFSMSVQPIEFDSPQK